MRRYNTDYFEVVARYDDFIDAVAKSEELNNGNVSNYLVDDYGDEWDYKTDPELLEMGIKGLYDMDDYWFSSVPKDNPDTYYVVSKEGNIGFTTDGEQRIDWFLALDYVNNFDELYFADEDEVNDMIERGM